MVTAVLAASVLLAGLPWWVAVLVFVVGMQPVAAFVIVGAFLAIGTAGRRADHDEEAAFFHSVGAELAAGASLRACLAPAASAAPSLALGPVVTAARAGLPASRVATLLSDALPRSGAMASAAWLLAAENGGPAARIMDSLATRVADEGKLVREMRGLTAQARASAWVVAGVPLLLLVAAVVTGRLAVSGDPLLLMVVVVGAGLQVTGTLVVISMLRRSVR